MCGVCDWCLVSTEPGAGAGAGEAGKPLATPEDEVRESVATLSLSQSAPAHARAEDTEDWPDPIYTSPARNSTGGAALSAAHVSGAGGGRGEVGRMGEASVQERDLYEVMISPASTDSRERETFA